VTGNINSDTVWFPWLQDIDAVVHLASVVHLPDADSGTYQQGQMSWEARTPGPCQGPQARQGSYARFNSNGSGNRVPRVHWGRAGKGAPKTPPFLTPPPQEGTKGAPQGGPGQKGGPL